MKGIVVRAAMLVVALLVAIAAFVVAATLEAGFWPQAAVALLAFLVAGWLLLRWSLRAHPNARALTWTWLAGGTALYALAAQLLVGRAPLRTLNDPRPAASTKYWALDAGVRIAYEHVAAAGGGAPNPVPVVVLHDGPGMPALPFYQALGSRPLDFLASDGYDVYYYDQRGAGLSTRLDLRSEAPYTVAGHVADLEAIRRTLDVPTMIVAGTGWGATLATSYLLQHPDRVARLILESPEPMWVPAWPERMAATARARMTDLEASALAALERPPLRLVLGRMMADFSSRAAHAFIPDWEGDQWWTRSVEESNRLGQPNLTCRSDPGQGIPAPSGLGFFAYSYTLADAARLPDPRPALAEHRTDVLIIRGSCDYIDWQVSAEYAKVFAGSHYVAIPAAGHFIWLEQPSLWRDVLQAYVRGEALPLEAYNPGR